MSIVEVPFEERLRTTCGDIGNRRAEGLAAKERRGWRFFDSRWLDAQTGGVRCLFEAEGFDRTKPRGPARRPYAEGGAHEHADPEGDGHRDPGQHEWDLDSRGHTPRAHETERDAGDAARGDVATPSSAPLRSRSGNSWSSQSPAPAAELGRPVRAL
jgi:hypothetical protein